LDFIYFSIQNIKFIVLGGHRIVWQININVTEEDATAPVVLEKYNYTCLQMATVDFSESFLPIHNQSNKIDLPFCRKDFDNTR
jgi:hypothetical protein